MTSVSRPPVRQRVTVRSDVVHTFDVFVATIGDWWPLRPFARNADRACDVVLERRVGGRVYEVWDDGATVDWGEIRAWDPPRRFVMSWRQTPAVTEVELTFTAVGESLTRVEVEHRGWEALTPDALGVDCALPGGYSNGAYAQGWAAILRRFAETFGPLAEGPVAGDIEAGSR